VYHNAIFLSHWENVGTAFGSHAFVGAGGESIYYRPLLTVSYIIDFHIWKLNPFGYHLTNILLHCLTSLGVFFLLLFICQLEFPAFAGALVFAIHPIQTESVAWIAGRNDVLLGFFVVAMMIFYAVSIAQPANEKWFRFFAWLAFLAALFTKESSVFYLLLLPLYDLCTGTSTLRKIGSFDYFRKIRMMIITVIVYCGIRLMIFGTVIGAERLYGHRTIGERLADVFPIIAENLKFIFLPINLSIAHPVNELQWFLFPWNILAFASVLILIVGAVWFWRNDRILCFGVLWIVVGFLPLMGLIPVAIPILEHRLYVPMAGFAVVAARSMQLLLEKSNFRTVSYFVVFLLGIILAFASYRRLPVWSNGITLFTDAVQKAPSYPTSFFSLGAAYFEAEQYTEAIQPMKMYLSQAPVDPNALSLLREIYFRAQRYTDGAEISRKLILLEPHNALRRFEAGMLFEAMHQYDSAMVMYQKGLTLDTTNDELYLHLAGMYQKQGRMEDAEKCYQRVLQENPLDAVAPVSLARAFENQGNNDEAIHVLEQRIAAGEPSREMIDLLVSLYNKSGDLLKADQLSKRFHQ
ncbi:MAG TPA: tetratricopeptide repeat protein, partial [Bacteroidota bacterium]|nr:tetratricopeptide repeat protein [Bacteroidota bacterium]